MSLFNVWTLLKKPAVYMEPPLLGFVMQYYVNNWVRTKELITFSVSLVKRWMVFIFVGRILYQSSKLGLTDKLVSCGCTMYMQYIRNIWVTG